MKVRSGWSTEYARDKFDVEVDEADLERLCAEWQIDPAYRTRITPFMAFGALSTLAESLATFELSVFLHGRLGTPDMRSAYDNAYQKALQAQQRHSEAMNNIRIQLGLDAPQQPAQGQPGAAG